jgi:hypothetical protein
VKQLSVEKKSKLNFQLENKFDFCDDFGVPQEVSNVFSVPRHKKGWEPLQ